MTPPTYRLGINHHLLYPPSMADPAYHEQTLGPLLAWPEFAHVDMFCAGDAAQRAREAALVRASGKGVVYNSPLLYTLPGCDPNATDAVTCRRTREAMSPHLDAAADCGARVLAVASGKNPPPEQRRDAWMGWLEFLAWLGGEAQRRGLRVVIEPFDQSIGKNLLIGPTAEAVRSIAAMRDRGIENVGLMVDMGHLPIMGESFHTGITLSRPYLWHVHLGSAVMRDPAHPWYGDCHPPLGLPEGEHDSTHLTAFLRELRNAGYFASADATLSFEMRPYPGLTERGSAERWLAMLREAWAGV